jgi:hypothetical protein
MNAVAATVYPWMCARRYFSNPNPNPNPSNPNPPDPNPSDPITSNPRVKQDKAIYEYMESLQYHTQVRASVRVNIEKDNNITVN